MRRKEIVAQKQQTQTKPRTTPQTQMSLPQERERERERVNQPFKRAYTKALFTLIKAYKRHYFGLQLLALPYFKLTKNAVKIQKWQRKSCERREFLHEALSGFKSAKHLYKTFHKESEKWLNSLEFKEKYLDTNYPYTPLLNPNKIDYKNIDANLAWEWNLPLPKGYKFLCVMASFNAHTSMVNYLKKCDVSIVRDHLPNIKQHYIFNYNEILKNSFVAINITAYTNLGGWPWRNDTKKLILTTENKSPILWIVRCPMQRLISCINNSWGKANIIYDFNENTPLTALENRKYYWIDKDLNLSDRIRESIKADCFTYAELYDFFTKYNFTNHAFLDMQDYKESQDIFNLFNELSKIYGFTPPKHKDDFTYKWSTLHYGILPLYYTINGIKFTITNTNFNEVEVSEVLTLQKNDFTKNIFVYTDTQNIVKIKNNNKIKSKIQAFIDKLAQVLEYEVKHNRINKENLMKFLQINLNDRKLLREIFNKEVKFVKRYRPDIVKSWKYYNEFEKMCQEFDDN